MLITFIVIFHWSRRSMDRRQKNYHFVHIPLEKGKKRKKNIAKAFDCKKLTSKCTSIRLNHEKKIVQNTKSSLCYYANDSIKVKFRAIKTNNKRKKGR